MELNFTNKRLVSFDASYLAKGGERYAKAFTPIEDGGRPTADADASSLSSLLERAPVVRGINLSHNAIHMFIGGETLRHVVTLDLSHNALSLLNTNSLPPALLRLNLSSNNLRELSGLASHVPTLQELDISHNAFTASGLRDFPPSLRTLYMQGNEVDSFGSLATLKRLAKLDASGNQLEAIECLEGLRALTCLHHLELHGNTVVSAAAALLGVPERTAMCRLLAEVAPRLATLDGQALSQAPSNSRIKANQSAAAAARASANTSRTQQPQQLPLSVSSSLSSARGPRAGELDRASGVGSSLNRATRTRSTDSAMTHSTAVINKATTRTRTGRSPPRAPPMEIRLMEAKVAELRRLLSESEKEENQERYERGILMDQIKSCAGVIGAQAAELEALQKEIAALEEEEQSLRDPVAAMERTFEQTHATLIAQKVELLGSGTTDRVAAASRTR